MLGVPKFPIRPLVGALYLQFLLELSNSVSTINCSFHAFKWLHHVVGLQSPIPFIPPSLLQRRELLSFLVSKHLTGRNRLKWLISSNSLIGLTFVLVCCCCFFFSQVQSYVLCSVRTFVLFRLHCYLYREKQI